MFILVFYIGVYIFYLFIYDEGSCCVDGNSVSI